MIPSHTQRHNRRYRYYVAASQVEGREGIATGGLRIPAHDLEDGVWGRLRDFLSSPTQLLNALGEIGGRQAQVIQAGARAIRDWEGRTTSDRRAWLKGLLEQVVVSPTSLTLHLNRGVLSSGLGIPKGLVNEEELEGPITLESEVRFKRGGRGLRYVIPGPGGAWGGNQQDKPLLQAIARGRFWYDQLLSGQAKSREEIARANGLSGQHVIRHIHLAWLAPDIVEAILDGRQLKSLTVKRLLEKLPMDWAEQRRLLGFDPLVRVS
jgi:hypothetical protein